MPRDYWHCPDCNGNFDHGVSCDCHIEETVLILGDVLILGVDFSGGKDISCVQIARRYGNTSKIVNTLYGKEAEEAYRQLTGKVDVA